METNDTERLPYEPPMMAELGAFGTETRGAVGLIPEYMSSIPH